MITHAITCNGPFAILVMLGIKRLENRVDRPVPTKGRCAVSCSKTFTRERFGDFVQWASRALAPEDFARVPSWNDVSEWPGKLVGACDYSVRDRNDLVLSPGAPCPQWDEGLGYFWDFAEVASFDAPIPCRGALDFWSLAPDLVDQVNAADALSRCVGEKVSTAEDAARIFRHAVPVAGQREGFFVLPLDSERRVLTAPILVSLGFHSGTTVVSPGKVYAAALENDAAAIIIAHNHPSGNLVASLQDRQLTDVLVDLGRRLGVKVLDHLIIGNGGEYVVLNGIVH